MPSKKKKYNARFPAGRIKKIMQSDEEVGKVAQAVPIIISRTLELFVESLLNKTLRITNARNAKTLSTSHMKQCIMSESRFDFLRELVKNVPDINIAEEQATADNPTSEIGTAAPTAATSLTATLTAVAASSGAGSSSNSGGQNNGNCSSTNSPSPSTHRSNGNKRTFQFSQTKSNSSTTAAATTIQSNVHSGIAATTTTTITPQTSQIHNIHGPGFYKDHFTDQSTEKASVIQYTPKLQTQKSIPNSDIRPPKLKRVDSAPAGANMYLNSPATIISTPPLSASPLKMTMTNVSKKVPPLTPIKATSTTTSATQMSTNQQSIRQSTNSTTFVYPSTSKDGTTSGVSSAPIVKIDVTNSTNPVVKIDYSNLSLPTHLYASASTSSSSSSSSYQMPSTSASTASATKSAAMVNIDLLNNCATPSMAYKPITMTSSTLEMDEDYDNI